MKSNEKLHTSQQITVVYPLCLAVSDGGELWRGRCSVSVRGRSLYTLFRSTHAYAGECSGFPLKVSQSVSSSKYMPLTASWPLYISAALCFAVVLSDIFHRFKNVMNNLTKSLLFIFSGHIPVWTLWEEQSNGHQVLWGIRHRGLCVSLSLWVQIWCLWWLLFWRSAH